MKIAIPKECSPETRVALVPTLLPLLTRRDCTILMEKDAGLLASYPDSAYEGVEFFTDPKTLYQQADVILKVNPPTPEEIQYCKKNTIIIGLLAPRPHLDVTALLQKANITSFALELIPRITRAQPMDALSSQSTVAGYKAALLAANTLPRFFPMLTTAAGTIRPANVLVIGAGVAGLQAIATAHRLGAQVSAYDVRAAAREQVESLGAKMVKIEVSGEGEGGYARELSKEEKVKQQEALKTALIKAEAVITTALIPGKKAPIIITKEMVESMSPGAVIIDIAASMGGNCELTEPGKALLHHHVTIYGPLNLPGSLPKDASNMYAKNIISFLELIIKDKQIHLNWEDPILNSSVLTHEGLIKNQ